jgi:hypothetical protein
MDFPLRFKSAIPLPQLLTLRIVIPRRRALTPVVWECSKRHAHVSQENPLTESIAAVSRDVTIHAFEDLLSLPDRD